VGMVLCGLLALGGETVAEGLGVGRGIDHVGMRRSTCLRSMP